ncbi:MAG: HNH endonuclease signature motif containing protein, partial [Nocardioides sp.]
MTEHRSSASRHQVSRAVDAVSAQLSEVMDSALWSLSAEETAGTLTALTRLIAKASALEARVAHHASVVQVEDLDGATSTATWWAHATRQTRVEAFRKVHLAAGLEKYGLVQSALARGDLVVD